MYMLCSSLLFSSYLYFNPNPSAASLNSTAAGREVVIILPRERERENTREFKQGLDNDIDDFFIINRIINNLCGDWIDISTLVQI